MAFDDAERQNAITGEGMALEKIEAVIVIRKELALSEKRTKWAWSRLSESRKAAKAAFKTQIEEPDNKPNPIDEIPTPESSPYEPNPIDETQTPESPPYKPNPIYEIPTPESSPCKPNPIDEIQTPESSPYKPNPIAKNGPSWVSS